MLVVRRIRVVYHLRLRPDQRETAQRVLGFHADFCPMYRSVKAGIDVTTELDMQDIE